VATPEQQQGGDGRVYTAGHTDDDMVLAIVRGMQFV
jgi:hypothetical protein